MNAVEAQRLTEYFVLLHKLKQSVKRKGCDKI